MKPQETERQVTLYRAQTLLRAPSNRPSWLIGHPDAQNGEQAAGRWFTDELEEADWYLRNDYPHGEGHIVVVTMSAAESERFRVSNLPEKAGGKGVAENPRAYSRRPDKEFFLPRDLAARAVPFAPEMQASPAAAGEIDLEAAAEPEL